MMMTGYTMRENNNSVDVNWSATPGEGRGEYESRCTIIGFWVGWNLWRQGTIGLSRKHGRFPQNFEA
jgi:hypothetical protein